MLQTANEHHGSFLKHSGILRILRRSLPSAIAAITLSTACEAPAPPGRSVAWSSDGFVILGVAGEAADTLCRGFYPAISPDGLRIACVRDDPATGGSMIVVLDRASRSESVIMQTPGMLLDLSWAPDGRALAFVVADPCGSRSLQVCAPDGSCLSNLVSTDGLQGSACIRPTWLPGSQGLLYSDGEGLRKVLLDGTSREVVPLPGIADDPLVFTLADRFVMCPADTSLVAYTRLIEATVALAAATGVGSTHALFLFDRDDSSSLQLTTSGMCALDPAWASDGSAIFFSGYDTGLAREGRQSVFALDPASGRCEAVAPGQSPTVN